MSGEIMGKHTMHPLAVYTCPPAVPLHIREASSCNRKLQPAYLSPILLIATFCSKHTTPKPLGNQMTPAYPLPRVRACEDQGRGTRPETGSSGPIHGTSANKSSRKFAATNFAPFGPQAAPWSPRVGATSTNPLHIATILTAESGERLRLATSPTSENFSCILPIEVPVRGARPGMIGVSYSEAAPSSISQGHARLGPCTHICSEHIASEGEAA
jgi:hypothetical protein